MFLQCQSSSNQMIRAASIRMRPSDGGDDEHKGGKRHSIGRAGSKIVMGSKLRVTCSPTRTNKPTLRIRTPSRSSSASSWEDVTSYISRQSANSEDSSRLTSTSHCSAGSSGSGSKRKLVRPGTVAQEEKSKDGAGSTAVNLPPATKNESEQPLPHQQGNYDPPAARSPAASSTILHYTHTEMVDLSWARVQRIENYKQVLGNMLLAELTARVSNASALLGLSDESSRSEKEVAEGIVDMVEAMVTVLGPDLDPLIFLIQEFTMPSSLVPALGQAVCSSLNDLLQEDFTAQAEESWRLLFNHVVLQLALPSRTS